MLKKIIYFSIFICLLAASPVVYYLIFPFDESTYTEKDDCLALGGTAVEFDGKFERCIPR